MQPMEKIFFRTRLVFKSLKMVIIEMKQDNSHADMSTLKTLLQRVRMKKYRKKRFITDSDSYQKAEPAKTGSFLYKWVLTHLGDKNDDLARFNAGINSFLRIHTYE